MKKLKWKIGDVFLATKGQEKGNKWKVTGFNDSTEFPIEARKISGKRTDYGIGELSTWKDEGDMQKVKSETTIYFLEYMLEEDPIEKFYDLESVKTRIEELTRTESSLKLDQIFVYESKKETKIEVEKKTIIKGIQNICNLHLLTSSGTRRLQNLAASRLPQSRSRQRNTATSLSRALATRSTKAGKRATQ